MVLERMETEVMESEVCGHGKRKNASNEVGKINGKKARKQFDPTGKNSLQVLFHEFNQGTQTIDFLFEDISESGRKPSYKALAEIEGVSFEGVGPSKLMAKRSLASKALAQLRSIFISPDYPDKVSETADATGSGKNPLQILNEEFSQGKAIDFQFDFTGTVQNPSYKSVAEINGTLFEGVGASKHLAKRALACTALAQLKNDPSMDLTSTVDVDGKCNPFDLNKAPLPPNMFSKLPAASLPVSGGKKTKVDVEKAQHHPYMVLMEVYPDLNIEWTDELGRGDEKFKVEAVVNGVTFFGEGRSKKAAKHALAKNVLTCLHDVTDFVTDFKEEKVASEAEKTEKSTKKKLVLGQLKDITGEKLSIKTVRQEGADEESTFLSTIVAKGISFEAVGKTKFSAKIKAAKKALAAQPKVVVDLEVDTSRHPNAVFQQHFKDACFNDSENTKEDGSREYCLETTIQGQKFITSASSKKKAKLQLVLEVFEVLKNISPTKWTAIDQNEIPRSHGSKTDPTESSPL